VGAPCWVDLFTSDPDKTRPFYEQLFGWTSEEAGPEYGGYVNFAKDGVPVGGCMRNDGAQGQPDAWSIYLSTDDAKKTTELASANGGQVYLEPMAVGPIGIMGMVADPGGAAIGMWQPLEFNGFGAYGDPGTPAWFELHTRDFTKSVDFYRDVFRWETQSVGDSDEFRYTVLVDGEEQLAGVMDAAAFLPEGVPAHWSVYFGTADADTTVAKALELGATVVQPAEDTPYGRLATLTDPTGAQFKLVQPPPAAA
jgi:predicted enzyme related to lactoylglutathione lyase